MTALSAGVTLAWWVSLGLGLVVAAVVAVLLEVLRRSVRKLEDGVEQVLLEGGHVAQHTWAVQLLTETRGHGVALLAELGRHGGSAERSAK